MRVLITGGNGYVGREVVRLLADEHDVCVVDNLRAGPLRIAPAILARIRFEQEDIEDGEAMARLARDVRPEAVIHLAAIHYIPECEADPSAAVRTNVVGTVNLLRVCPSGCRFVFASSGAVYAPASEPHDEARARIGPNDVYGLTKLQGEAYVGHLAGSSGLSAVNVRLFNVIGPGETNPHLVPEIVAQLRSGRKTIKLGNLWPKRDYVHVRDAARGFVATALNSKVEAAETITVNLGTSRSYSVAEVLRKLRRIAGVKFTIEQDEGRIRTVDRPHLAADIRRIQQLFGWEPRLSIDEALADLWINPDLSERLIARYA
ncbi:NAD-dependent epimerase/dehydratase family protein [Hansschlegelia zhihuaiae]|uniref:UDP-glucose 4-epimerase n=1 Tax=Hansschlegelia zhihuaiae TaxID=405005 RepID=A0A4Q0MC82_9HYPH|nr:NAD-dependent epimerase/dehydratase family protein [Hansschlegelia zhihuaiae]RXF70947.1 UDP-glucose 4-epimerase [Hansschlegelia zhihuaiae]